MRALLVALLLAGCTTGPIVAPAHYGLGEPPYRVGDTEVRVLSGPEVQRTCERAGVTVRVLGCHIATQRLIVATPDIWVLLHEMKHALEGLWHP